MSYNILNKNVKFQGATQGTVEDLVDTHSSQAITGSKDFNSLTGSNIYAPSTLSVGTEGQSHTVTIAGNLSASLDITGSNFYGHAYYGNGANLANVGSITGLSNAADNRLATFSGATTLNGEANLSFDGSTLTASCDISGSGNISGSQFYGTWAGAIIDGGLLEKNSSGGIGDSTGLTLTTSGVTAQASPGGSSKVFIDESGIKYATIDNILANNSAVTSLAAASTTDRVITSNGASSLQSEQYFTFNETDGMKIANGLNISGSGEIKATSHFSGSGDVYILGKVTASAMQVDEYITHNGDSDTFFGFAGADNWKVAAGGADLFTAHGDLPTKKVEIGNADFKVNTDGLDLWITSSTGYVGIGVADPDSPLEVLSTAAQFKLSYDAANAAQFTVANNGNLTINPNGTTTVDSAFLVNGNTTLGDASGDNLTINGLVASIPNDLNINSGHMFLDQSSKQVGLGTATPSARLHISASAEHETLLSIQDYALSNVMYVSSSGNIGIGTSAPLQLLSVSGSVGISGSVNLENPTSGSVAGVGSYLGLDTDGNIILTTSGGGSVSAVANGVDNRVTTFSSADALNGEANLTFDGTSLTVTGDSTIDKNHSDTNATTITSLQIDFDKTGNSTSNNTMYGLNIDMDNTTATNGDNYMYGIYVTPTLTHAANAGNTFVYGAHINAQGGTNGTSLVQGARIEAGGGDINYGLQLDVEDGGVDFRIESSADNGDYFQIQTTTHGATTITTQDDDATAAHLTFNVDGNITLDPAGGNVVVDGTLSASAMTIDASSISIDGIAVTSTAPEINYLSSVAAGTAAASKALVLSATKAIGTISHVTASNLSASAIAVNASGLSIDGTAVTSTAPQINYLSAVVAGTAAGNKAIVVDASKNIATLGTIGCGAITSTGTSTFDGGITPASANGAALGSATKEWADLYLADGSVIYMGNSQDVTMTHSANEGIVLEATNDGGSNPTSINLRLSSSSPADNDEIAAINFSGYNDNEQPEVFAQIKSKATDVSDGSEDGSLIFSTFVNGSPTQMFDLSSTTVGAATFHTDVTISGSTPFLTIGDSGAEDCGVLLNSSGSGMSGIDYYMAIDYSYNSNNGAFMIGAGTSVGSNSALQIHNGRVGITYSGVTPSSFSIEAGKHLVVGAMGNTDPLPAHNQDETVIAQAVDSAGQALMIPEKSVITKVVLVVTNPSNLGTHNAAVFLASDSNAAADAALSNKIELLGAGAAGTKSTDNNGSATDIDLKQGKEVWINTDLNWLGGDRYVYLVNTGTGNGTATSDGASAVVYVEYYGID